MEARSWLAEGTNEVTAPLVSPSRTVPVVILAGGSGTRLQEETAVRPKPMVRIGDRPILWHVMKIYDHFGYRRFIVAVGYKGDEIKSYFLSYADQQTDFTVNTHSGDLVYHNRRPESWEVTVVDTGLNTMTGGRIRRLASYLPGRFMLTYGDGVANVDIDRLLAFHVEHGRLATVTAVPPPARFGALRLDGDRVAEFYEKRRADAGWINGGFFVFERAVLDYLGGDESILEQEPLERLASDGQLMAFGHEGFWEPLDTVRDLDHLNRLWTDGSAPWKVWDV